MFHFPLLIYNSQIKSLITKEWLSEKEKDTLSEHSVLYQNIKLKDLTSVTRDFSRYIVELTKPVQGILKGKWGWIILIGALVLLALLFGKPIYNAVISGGGTLAQTVTNTGGAITPIT